MWGWVSSVGGGAADAGQAVCADAGVGVFDVFHQWGDAGFGQAVDEDGALVGWDAVEALGVVGVQHPFGHGVCHDGEAGQEVVVQEGEAGDAVVGVGDDLRALGEVGHVQALAVFGGVGGFAAFAGYGFD